MNIQSLSKKKENPELIETQEEEGPTFPGKMMKLPLTLVTPKSRMKMIYASLVT